MRAKQFVGQRDPLEQIEQHLYHIMTGQPRVVLVQSIAGVGKTCFLEPIRTMAVCSGLQVYAGYGDEILTQPYVHFAGLMTELEEDQNPTFQPISSDHSELDEYPLIYPLLSPVDTSILSHLHKGHTMSMQLDAAIANSGTRFRIFPQPRYLSGFDQPETIRISITPNDIQAGPADDRMFVNDAIGKRPYDRFNQRPFTGTSHPPLPPGPDGHFDHLDVDSRTFTAATMYATVRRVLDIWQDYFGRRIEWHFIGSFASLELIPLISWDNAQSGFGFLEFGFGRTPEGGIDRSRPYAQNFDVLAHELGHSIIFAEVGTPSVSTNTDEYGGFHESAGDLVALVSALHFHKVVDHLLASSQGNLFTPNELNRIGELSASRQIRRALNYERMSTVSVEPHDLSLPLTGAIFDIFVEVFQKELVKANLISQELADRSYHTPEEDEDDEAIQAAFRLAYQGKEAEFKTALFRARDYLGQLLAHSWDRISPHFLAYDGVARQLLMSDRELTDGAHQETIRDCFSWREISLPTNPFLLEPRRLGDCGLMDTDSGGYLQTSTHRACSACGRPYAATAGRR